MSDPNDLAPSSSYSDPFYDRIDAVARFLRRNWHLAVAVVIIAVSCAILLRWKLAHHPEAAGAVAYLHAEEQAQAVAGDRVKQVAAYAAVLADPATTPYFKARAAIEQVHLHLLAGDVPAARAAAQVASDAVKLVEDAALPATVRLSQAAIELQAEQLDAALAAYSEAERLAGPRQPALQIDAILGQARVYERQAKPSDAIAALEPLITRSDVGAEALLTVAKARYWHLKRLVAEAAMPKPAEPAPAPVAIEPAPAPAPAAVEPAPAPAPDTPAK
jgi:predicted negative regulator of RcsB-dependent stress response